MIGTITPDPTVQSNKFLWVDTDSHRLKAGQSYTYFATTTYNRKNANGQPIQVESDLSNIVTFPMANNNPAFASNSIPAQVTFKKGRSKWRAGAIHG